MNHAKEQWIQDVMDAAKNRADAPGNPYLHTRILARINESGFSPAGPKISPRWILAAAAGFCMLVMVNIVSMSRLRHKQQNSDGAGQVVQEYGMSVFID